MAKADKVKDVKPGTLYVVSTPIGNMEDITHRAIRILGEVDLIAAEDTRRTRKLLTHFNIHKELTSYHLHNERIKSDYILGAIRQGKHVALVSDAGTPGISDPGYTLICEALEQKLDVVPIPGVSAVITALSVGGIPTTKFTFVGFLPSKKGRRRAILKELSSLHHTLVFYMAKWDAAKLLPEIIEIFGDRNACLARELTKLYEEFRRSPLSEILSAFKHNQAKGELTLIVEGKT